MAIAGAAPSVFVWSGNEHLEVARYFPDLGRILPLLPGSRAPGVALSQTGDWLSFAIGGDLWRSRADGSQRGLLVSGFPVIRNIQWSPDGRRILFRTTETASPGRSFLAASDGGGATEHDTTLAQSGIYLLDSLPAAFQCNFEAASGGRGRGSSLQASLYRERRFG